MTTPSLTTSSNAIPVPRSRRYWDWRRDLNYLCMTIAAVLWLIPLLDLLTMGAPDDVYPEKLSSNFVLIGAHVLIALTLRRYMIYRRMTLHNQMPYFFVATLVAMLITIPLVPIATGYSSTPDFNFGEAFKLVGDEYFPRGVVFIPIVALLWSRGFALGKHEITPVSVSVQMRLGILIYFIVAIVGTAKIQTDMLNLLPFFFASALMSTALARAQSLKIEEELRDRQFGLSWLGFITALVLSVTIAGYLLAIVFADVDRAEALEVLTFIGTGIIVLLFILASPVLWLLEQIIHPFIEFFQTALFGTPIEVEESGTREVVAAQDVDQVNLRGVIEFLGDSFFTIFGIIAILLFVGAILNFLYILLVSHEDDTVGLEESESIDEREVIGGLKRAFNNQFKRLSDALGLLRNFGVGRGLVGALTVRWAYTRMERESKKRGFPRQQSQTPYEFRRDCYKAYPECDREIKLITEAYVGIRYGELPESEEDLAKVRQALDKLMASKLGQE